MHYENESTDSVEAGVSAISEMSIAIVDNGFIIRVHGRGIQKNFVVQAGSSDPSEIDLALDVIRKIYMQERSKA